MAMQSELQTAGKQILGLRYPYMLLGRKGRVTFHFVKRTDFQKLAAVIRPRFIKTVLLQTTLRLVFYPNEEKGQSQDNLAW